MNRGNYQINRLRPQGSKQLSPIVLMQEFFMKSLACTFVSRHLCLFGLLFSTAVIAEDTRQLATLPPPAQEVLRQEMMDNLVALNEILTALAAGNLKEAGEIAEQKLGVSAQGKHRDKPFEARPGPHMPQAMHALAMDGHRAASEFAKAARTGERERAMALLPNLTNACVACHFSYRIR